jgi:hypothetical protein
MAGIAFLCLLVLAVSLALGYGERVERVAISTVLANSVATLILYKFGSRDWLRPQFGIFAVDTATFALFLFLAIRSNRFWPLPLAAFQAIPVLVHWARMVGYDLTSYAIGVAQGASAYLQMIIIVAAVLVRRRQMRKRICASSPN